MAAGRDLLPRYDPFAPEVVDDPYPLYARLREAGPLCRGGPGQWVVTRHAEVVQLLASDVLGSEFLPGVHAFALGTGPAAEFASRIVLYRDPPAHTRLRQLLRRALELPAVHALAPRLPAMVDRLLAPALDGSPFDAVDDFAMPLSFGVMCELIGFPEGDAAEIRPRALALSRIFATRVPDEDRRAGDEAVRWLRGYMTILLDQRRRTPVRDALSMMGGDELGDLSRDELVDNLAFLLFAGFETTAHQIGNALGAFLAHPAQLDLLRAQPQLLGRATEEALRYDPPIQGVARAVRGALVIGDRTIKAGRILVLLVGSANRDAAAFVEPNQFDVKRHPNPHLSFGGGLHYCLGAALARLELSAVLRYVVERTMRVEAHSAGRRRRDSRFRCYASLPLTVRPA